MTERPFLFLPRERFQALLDTLCAQGFRCTGPQLHDGSIVYAELAEANQLPRGVRDRQAPGEYRIETGADARCFAWANGAQGLKPYLFAPQEVLWQAERHAGQTQFHETLPQARPIAFIGARACDLAALALQDAHFLQQAYVDPYYARRRENLFIVAVDCSHPAATCFCVSTGDGPAASAGYDIALAELEQGYVARAGSARGQGVLEQLALAPASAAQRDSAIRQNQRAVSAQTRQLPSRNLHDVLFAQLAHPRWQEVAERCLSCGNCTSVCPTCFCHQEVEQPQLDGTRSDHVREWDSCFTQGHSYIHGIVVRSETKFRYRQWLTHKLGSWHEQYGRSGCVGCGRCLTWCPVGIDLTEEVAAICGEDHE